MSLDIFADLIEALEEDGYMVIPKSGPTPEQERELVPLLVGHGHLTCPQCGAVYEPAKETPAKRGKGKRSLVDMMASMATNPAAQTTYVLERIAAVEDQIASVLAVCPADARAMVIEQRPELKRYAKGGKS
jgi:hypothetical protein